MALPETLKLLLIIYDSDPHMDLNLSSESEDSINLSVICRSKVSMCLILLCRPGRLQLRHSVRQRRI